MSRPILSLSLFFGLVLSALAVPPSVQQWMDFERSVRDGAIEKSLSRKKLPEIMEALKEWGGTYPLGDNQPWAFPLKGYGLPSIGGKDGNGFKPNSVYGASPIKGYDFFDGNRHGGHPAHDIFIQDSNQDTLDDRTGQSVEAVAMVDALVIDVFADWAPGSLLRGGNVVWLYHPPSQQVHYYAHLKTINVQPGDLVKAGQSIGPVGRTGLTAQEPRSPTHLHLMVLEFNGATLVPFNFFDKLKVNPK